MTKQTIGKALRFEVLKRDKFTCQYCGAKAPDVLLHVDHVHPESKGGEATMLNLVSACAGCNLGKSDRLLSDDSAVSKQQAQLSRLAERREQVEMMVEWRADLAALDEDFVNILGDEFRRATGFEPNESDCDQFRRLLKKATFEEILDALDQASDQYIKERPAENAAVSQMMKVLPRICAARQKGDHELLGRAAYAFGIVRNRFPDRPWRAKDAIEAALRRGVHHDVVNRVCRQERSIWVVIERLDGEGQ